MCFRGCFEFLVDGIKKGEIKDVVWNFNLLNIKLKNRKTEEYLAKSLGTLSIILRDFGIDALFGKRSERGKWSRYCPCCDRDCYCLVCRDTSLSQKNRREHMLQKHGWSKHTSYQAATCNSVEEMRIILRELKRIPSTDRVFNFTDKKVICPHCVIILPSKIKLLHHIKNNHKSFAEAAALALHDMVYFYEEQMFYESFAKLNTNKK